MNEFSQTESFKIIKEMKEHDVVFLHNKLSEIDGIESCDISNGIVKLEFMSYKLSEKSVKEILTNLGYPLKSKQSKPQGVFRRFIDNLAKSNKKSFGTRKLDCCELKQNQG